jgi:hypothetical protein
VLCGYPVWPVKPPVSDTQNRTGIGSDFWEGNWNRVSKPHSVLEPAASKTGPSSKPQTGIFKKYLGKMVWNRGVKHQFETRLPRIGTRSDSLNYPELAAMVEGDEKSKHICSLGGWVQAAQQVEELVISVLERAKLTIQEKVYVVGL